MHNNALRTRFNKKYQRDMIIVLSFQTELFVTKNRETAPPAADERTT